MEVDEIQRHVSKYQRVSSNGSTTTTDNSSNPQKLATGRVVDDGGGGSGVGGGGGGGIDVVGGGSVGRLYGWPSSRIVRVSRASGGKDRHSKVLTSKGLRDRRVRLSVGTAIQFYDLQDRLGYDQPSKAVEWLLKAAASSIDELPSLDLPIAGAISDLHHIHQMSSQNNRNCNNDNNNNNDVSRGKSPSCSSNSETSKGSGLSLSRSENRIKARERAREITASRKEKEKEKEIDSTGGFTRGTLQSNLQSTLLPHHHHHHLQRFQSSSIDGSTPTNLPFFIFPNAGVDHFPGTGGYHLSYGGGGDGSGRHSDHHKEKSKN
ncbi:hypothetical protein L1987_62962 [Smallanthus sonchifolius]|uniref:Uncharacterized protein n=1 Tax=Smallanthus sonchifolius TaxID=185202 RepID=A0ACB9CC07_9ASTR|nr:hypothetical protein L1987_62962 [Smallanthus sonchifolius]